MKRLFDLILGIVAIPVLLPIIVITAIFVRLNLGGPVLFTQIRPGKDAKPFKLVKFRSMTDARGSDGELLPDAQRLTSFGKFLRSSSLDELPEIWNVLKGEMSFVGPRPLLMEYVPLYSDQQARRMNMRPGITGWAQIMGRNTISWDQKFAHDIWYVENHNLWIDVKILFLTVASVLKRDGINAGEDMPMPKFTGNRGTR